MSRVIAIESRGLMTAASGIVAALAAPLLSDIGFIIWDKHWKGSSFALNLYKCSLASIGFLILSLVTRPPEFKDGPPFPSELFTAHSVGFLMLSATIGILVGDWTWLEALQLIGARQVVFMDSVKPGLAAIFGWVILGERLVWPAFVGMALTIGGVVVISLERQKPKEDKGGEGKEAEDVKGDSSENDDEENNDRSSRSSDKFEDDAIPDKEEEVTAGVASDEGNDDNMDPDSGDANVPEHKPEDRGRKKCKKQSVAPKDRRKGYIMAVANVLLDTYGALLTKQYGVGMSTWNINLIRFGFASACCLALSSILHIRDLISGYKSARTPSDNNISERKSLRGSVLQLLNYRLGKDIKADRSVENSEIILPTGDIAEPAGKRPWYSLPRMKRKSWIKISLGVLFVTFAHPALSNYALFQIALALALTLGSIGPVYMVPLAYVLQRERPTLRSCLGAILAVAGVAILSFFGR